VERLFTRSAARRQRGWGRPRWQIAVNVSDSVNDSSLKGLARGNHKWQSNKKCQHQANSSRTNHLFVKKKMFAWSL